MRHAFFLLAFLLNSLFPRAQAMEVFGPADYVRALKQATDIMVNDVTSPVAAARYYAYITISAREVLTVFDPRLKSVAGSVNGFSILTAPDSVVKRSDPSLAVILCIYRTSSKLLPSGGALKLSIDSVLRLSSKKLDPTILRNTGALVDTVVHQIIDYANRDGFRKLSGMRRYTPASGDAFWQPTPPAFMSALEPYWHTLRPFTLDSASQFKPLQPAQYFKDTSSLYYSLLNEVYLTTKSLDSNQAEIAMFWDCNPFALQQMGHVEFGLKKISPGGHWMGIAGIASMKSKKDMQETAHVHMVTAIAIADAFISCWDEKYRSNRIRPETGIKRLIDPLWQPLLQTPPFPEYPSGHSVISSAAATVLTKIFGDNFSYADDTETEFGLAARQFSSFNEAAAEAAISRLFGGIHYRDAIENGMVEGADVGKWVISKLGLP